MRCALAWRKRQMRFFHKKDPFHATALRPGVTTGKGSRDKTDIAEFITAGVKQIAETVLVRFHANTIGDEQGFYEGFMGRVLIILRQVSFHHFKPFVFHNLFVPFYRLTGSGL